MFRAGIADEVDPRVVSVCGGRQGPQTYSNRCGFAKPANLRWMARALRDPESSCSSSSPFSSFTCCSTSGHLVYHRLKFAQHGSHASPDETAVSQDSAASTTRTMCADPTCVLAIQQSGQAHFRRSSGICAFICRASSDTSPESAHGRWRH